MSGRIDSERDKKEAERGIAAVYRLLAEVGRREREKEEKARRKSGK